ncbi:MAG: hypothetical protein SGJ10_14305 [Bacteroidota bacterium]|nr:hypothetical protein [Bacteroidota bacterium]
MASLKKYSITFIIIISLTGILYFTWDYYNNAQELVKDKDTAEDSLKDLDDMDTIKMGIKTIEEIEEKYGPSKIDKFAGNYYIDKEVGYLFEVDNAQDYNLKYNFEKKIKPDDPILRCSPGKNIFFEITEVKLQKGMGIEDYVTKWYLPGLYGAGKYPKVEYNYQNQTAYFRGEYPAHKQLLYTKCSLKGDKVIVCVLRYEAKDSENRFVKALSKSVEGFKLLN